jgi:Cu2+-containing amine oxidase
MTNLGTNDRFRFMVLGPSVLLLAIVALARVGSSQDGVRVEQQHHPGLRALTAAERRDAVAAVVQQERRAATSLATGKRVETVVVERYHDEDKGARSSDQRAHVVLYNYETSETVSAIVSLGSLRVESMSVVKDQPPGLGPAEIERARQVALAHPTVRARLQAAGMAGREHELIITHLLVRAVAPGDPCFTRRCVALFFNTRTDVLGIEPIVDLGTGHVVEIQ